MLGGKLRWTSIPFRGHRNTPSRFIIQKPEISAGTDEPSGSPNYDWADFTYSMIVGLMFCDTIYKLNPSDIHLCSGNDSRLSHNVLSVVYQNSNALACHLSCVPHDRV